WATCSLLSRSIPQIVSFTTRFTAHSISQENVSVDLVQRFFISSTRPLILRGYLDRVKVMEPISIDDFHKVEIRVGEILSAEKIEGSDKLLRLMVEFGDEKRQVLSGIAKY